MGMDQRLEVAMIFTLPTTQMLEQLPTRTSVTPTNYPTVILIIHLKQKRCWQAFTAILQPVSKFIFLLTVSSFIVRRIYISKQRA